jgi:signal transduction histidine kinase
MCAPDTFARAISNLVDNSTKYGSQVVVELRSQSGQIEIDISDDGPGIATSMNEAVFAPFFRHEPSSARRGFGLGLSIARDIVRDHGGDIELLQNLPHGLRARVILKA